MGKITAIVAALQVISKKNFMAMAVPWHGEPAWNGDATTRLEAEEIGLDH